MTRDMTTGSPARLILWFTLPLIAGNIFQQLYGFVDTLIVRGVRQSAAACLVISILTAVVLTLFSSAIVQHLLVWMQTPPEIIAGAYDFISICFWGLPVTFALMMTTNMVRTLGNSTAPTIVLAFSLSTNIVLEPLFIMVFDWGIPGAAWAVVYLAQSARVAHPA